MLLKKPYSHRRDRGVRRELNLLISALSACSEVEMGSHPSLRPRRRRTAQHGQPAPEGRLCYNPQVPKVGLEPTLPKERDFESRASASSATSAGSGLAQVV